MLLQTTFLSPLFERSSTDLQSAEPSALAPSSATTDHHSSTGPMSTNVPVPNLELVPKRLRYDQLVGDGLPDPDKTSAGLLLGSVEPSSSISPRLQVPSLSALIHNSLPAARGSCPPGLAGSSVTSPEVFPLLAPARAAFLPGSPRRPPKLENQTFARWDQTFPDNKGSRTPPSAR